MMTSLNVPGYRATEQLYAGTRTLVYRGIRTADRQPVVIKLLRNEFPSFSELAQFRNQYTIAKTLGLSSIAQPYSLEAYRNSYALIMEDFGGVSLSQYVKQQQRAEAAIANDAPLLTAFSLPVADFLAIALQLADVLNGLYQHRVIHKDIKPANILIHPDTRRIKLIDFSIASLLPRETQAIQSPKLLEGTLAYLSPEQTGRMNRGIDYRSDFYSLGVTFYELLTGQLPFLASDPMELVHCHLAKSPPLLHTVNLAIPSLLSDVVAKLMAKNAENRYQSALGLKYDLEQCLSQWQATNTIAPFVLGTRDLSDRFTIPEKLYGREDEVAALLAAFERVAGNGWKPDETDKHDQPSVSSVPQSATELILVAGFSGIGKTAIVNEVHKPIARGARIANVRQRGYFIKGKYDQFQRNIPFSAFVQAFRDLMGQLLSESDAQLEQWKTKILAAIGDSGQVLLAVIPELERIIGQPPPALELAGEAAQNRFNRLFSQFMQVFTAPEHPLVIFIDDLQWADAASLRLMQLLLAEAETHHLLFIGAYRDHEVTAAHPLLLTVEAMQKAGAIVQTLTLAPLSQASVNQLVAETLSCSLDRAAPLTELIVGKTQGNPFFTTQFLKMLHEEGLITFNRDGNCWECDVTKVRSLALTDDVVEFMASQLQKLPAETQHVLKLAACIGNQFDLATLAIVSKRSPETTAADLWKALQEGLILPQSEVYKFFDNSYETTNHLELSSVSSASLSVAYRFLHDRVQQAAYSLIPEDQKQVTHYQIGQLLWRNTNPAAIELDIFDLVNQLNKGIGIITQPSERYELADLNLVAGKKAKASTAYKAAVKYLGTGIALLPADSWQEHDRLTVALHRECAECAYLIGDFGQAEALFNLALNRTQDVFDQVDLYAILMHLQLTQGEISASVTAGLEGLKALGITLPDRAEALQALTQAELTKMQAALATTSLQALLEQPSMTDPTQKAQMRLMAVLWSAAYVAGDVKLGFLVSLLMLNLSLHHGATESSGFAYCLYGVNLANEGDYKTAYEFGQLALALDRQLGAVPFIAKNNNHFCHAINPYARHLKTNLPLYQESFQICQETGDLLFGVWAVVFMIWTLLIQGSPLSEVYAETEKYRGYVERVNDQNMLYALTLQRQLLRHLQTPTAPTDFLDEALDGQPSPYIDVWRQQQLTHGINWYGLLKLQLLYLYDRYAEAVAAAVEIEQTLGAAAGFFPIVQYHFYYPLSLTALYSTATAEVKTQYWSLLQQQQQHLQRQAEACPANFRHRYWLLSAEMARLTGRHVEASEDYDRAIALAHENEYLSDAALANELAAKFYLAWGKERLAQEYLLAAYYAYVRWGAVAKVNALEQRYPELLAPVLQQRQPALAATETIFAGSFHASKTSTSSSISEALDLTAVLEVSQTLSSEIELDKLVFALLEVVVESAGAEKGVLMLLQDDRLMLVATDSDTSSPTLHTIPVEDSQEVPLSLVNGVRRTLEPSIVVDASQHPLLLADPYIQRHQTKSVLCTPILQQGKLLGVLYLENNLSTGVFTRDRVKLLNLLCSQAAISLENARLYQQSQAYAQQVERSLAALQASETRFQNLAANVPGMIYQFCLAADGSMSTPYVSPGCLDLYELEPVAVMTGVHSLYAMHHPDDHAAVAQAVAYSAQTLTPFEHEWRIVTPTGGVKWIQSMARPERQTDGAVAWDGIVIDISDRKCAEKSLKLTQFAIDHASLMIWWVKPNGQISYINDAGCRGLGYSQADIVGKYVWDFNPDFPPEAWDDHWQELKEKGCLAFEARHVNRLGNSYPVEVTLNYLEQDGEEYNFAFVRNISDRKQAEAQLQRQAEADQLLAAIAQTINQSVQLDQVLDGCLEQVRQFFQSDRVIICRFDAEYNVIIELEALAQPDLSLLGQSIDDSCFRQGWADRYREGYVTACNDAQAADLVPCYAALLAQIQVQASLAVGILQGDEIWGLLVVHHCHAPHVWQQTEIDLVKQLGLQIGIANQKALLYAQLEAELAERRRTEATLRLSEERYRSLAIVTSQIVWITGPDGQAEDLPSFRAYTGQTVEEVRGFGWAEALHPDDRDRTLQVWTHAVQTKSWYTIEFRLRATDGSYHYFLAQGVPMLDADGNIREWIGTCTDIDDRKQADVVLQQALAARGQKAAELEQTLQTLQRTQSQMVQAEKMSGLGQLVAGVAHEINNPVNFIYGNLTHANDYTNDLLGLLALYQTHYPTPHSAIQIEALAIDLDFLLEDLPKLLASMRVGAERIQKIVASLRTFSRMDEAEMKAVNLHDGIDSTLMILQHRLKAKSDHPGIEVVKHYGNLPLVECYAGQLNQVFMNVLSNAIDALEESADQEKGAISNIADSHSLPKPTITIRTQLVNGNQVKICIADNGSGIPDNVRQRLFNPFFTTKPVGKGTGMGLSISYQIVTEKHGGSLSCHSNPGQGAEFIIQIPLQQGAVNRGTVNSEQGTVSSEQGTGSSRRLG